MIKNALSANPIFLFLLLFVSLQSVSAQSDEKTVLHLLSNNEFVKAQALVNEIVGQRPGTAKALYFQALIEKNADTAIKRYNDILLLHKNSPFAAKALYKVCQYYFVKGFYFSARKNFLDLVNRYPDFAFRHDAGYYAAKCLLMTGKSDSAQIELNALLQANLSEDVRELIREDLQALQDERAKIRQPVVSAPPLEPPLPASSPKPEPRNYTVQIGAYSKLENANSQKKYLTRYGYSVDVVRAKVNRRYLYKVYVGRFASKTEAEQLAAALKAKHGMSYRIINLEE